MPESREGLLTHPAVIVGGVVVLGVLAYLVSQRNAAANVTAVTYANTPEGTAAQDAAAASIATAAISAGQGNIQTAAELIGLENTNATGITNTRNILAERYAEAKATLDEQLASDTLSSQTQQAIATITSTTQQAITDSNNRLAAEQASRAQAVALAQVAAQRQATTDNFWKDAVDVGAKVLGILSLGFL